MVKDTPPDPHGGLTGNIVDYLFAECLEGTKDDRVYLQAPDRSWTFRQLADRVGRMANFLKSLGIAPANGLLFSVVDGIDFPALFLGAMKIGPSRSRSTPISSRTITSILHHDSGAVVVVDHMP